MLYTYAFYVSYFGLCFISLFLLFMYYVFIYVYVYIIYIFSRSMCIFLQAFSSSAALSCFLVRSALPAQTVDRTAAEQSVGPENGHRVY